MKKILLLFVLNTSLNAEDKVNKDENITKNQQENSNKKDEKVVKNSKENSNPKNENNSKENIPKKPEYLEINSTALEIARKKVEKEDQFFNSCDSLIEELKNQNLIIEKGKKLYSYSPEELEKVLNIIKSRKKDVRNIQSTVMRVINDLLGQESKIEDFYLDDKEEKLIKNDQNNDVNKNNKNIDKDSLENFNEYFKEYQNKEEKDKIVNKIKNAPKVKIDFKDFEKSSQDAMKKLSGSYYKIADIMFVKLVLDSVEGKTWEEKKSNFKKELPNIQKAEAKMNEEMAESFKKKNEKKDSEKEVKEKVEVKEESKDKINPTYKQIIDTNFTYILFPLYGYSSFNPYTVALGIEKIWKQKGLMN